LIVVVSPKIAASPMRMTPLGSFGSAMAGEGLSTAMPPMSPIRWAQIDPTVSVAVIRPTVTIGPISRRIVAIAVEGWISVVGISHHAPSRPAGLNVGI
jgi:hypothetical protein